MGLVVLRGFRQPPSYFSEKLINQPLGHYFDVMTNGFGSMPSYDARVSPDDRWRIIAYIKNTIGISARVRAVAPDTLERSLGKAKRVIDKRPAG